MNFNFSHQPEYTLNQGLTTELIRLYGTPVKFVFMDKVIDEDCSRGPATSNQVFNDFKALKAQEGAAGSMERDVWVLLSETEGFTNGMGMLFNNFGALNDDTIEVLISIQELEFLEDSEGHIHPKELVSNCLVFPNGKVMEITSCRYHSPGINNKFVYSDLSSCFTLTLRSHNFDASAVSEAIPDRGSIKVDGIEAFLGNRIQRAELIKEEATKDTLTVENRNYSIKKSAKIDDVFGLM